MWADGSLQLSSGRSLCPLWPDILFRHAVRIFFLHGSSGKAERSCLLAMLFLPHSTYCRIRRITHWIQLHFMWYSMLSCFQQQCEHYSRHDKIHFTTLHIGFSDSLLVVTFWPSCLPGRPTRVISHDRSSYKCRHAFRHIFYRITGLAVTLSFTLYEVGHQVFFNIN